MDGFPDLECRSNPKANSPGRPATMSIAAWSLGAGPQAEDGGTGACSLLHLPGIHR